MEGSVPIGRFLASRREVVGLLGQFLEDLGFAGTVAALRAETGLLPDKRRAFMDTVSTFVGRREWQSVLGSIATLPVTTGAWALFRSFQTCLDCSVVRPAPAHCHEFVVRCVLVGILRAT